MALEFGYDSKSSDYIVARIFQEPEFKVELYTVRKDSWRQIKMYDVINPDCEIPNWYDYIFSKGFCYWGMVDYKLDYVILCFDLSREKFHIIPITGSGRYHELDVLCGVE